MQSSAAASEARAAAERLGFDPHGLLRRVAFPLDALERDVHRFRAARMAAMRGDDHLLVSQGPNGAQLLQQSWSDAAAECNLDEDELRITLRESAAATVIQAVARSWFTRVLLLNLTGERLSAASLRGTLASPPPQTTAPLESLAGTPDFALIERLREKFGLYCAVCERARLPLPVFPHYAASVIQAAYRGRLVRRYISKFRAAECQLHRLAPGDQQWVARYLPLSSRRQVTTLAAQLIQRAWRRYYNRKIYQFYRDLIQFRKWGSPRQLLRFVNPREAELMDAACGLHVKFRLGGVRFPPTVYYRVFAHAGIIDLNSFAPREYWRNSNKLPNALERHGTQTSGAAGAPPAHDGWYTRSENNGWRPIMDKVWHAFHADDEAADPVMLDSARKTVSYHAVRWVRRGAAEQHRRSRRVAWLKSLYSQAPEGSAGSPDATDPQEDDQIIQWSNALDFEAYFGNWLTLATTGSTQAAGDPALGDESHESEPCGAAPISPDPAVRPYSARGVQDLYLSETLA